MADNFKLVQAQKFSLSGSGMASGATSFTLKSFKLPDGSTNITMTDFGSTGYGTLEPGTSREEHISFTGVTQNGDGTATLTGVATGLDFTDPYTTAVAANKKAHAGGSIFVLTNSVGMLSNFAAKDNEETISQVWTYSALPATTAGDPVADNDLARKAYVDNVVAGSFPSERTVVGGTAGETIADGDLIYFDTVTNNEWMKCDANTAATVDNVMLGIAQGAGTDGNAITNGVLVKGVDDAQTGMTAGDLMYASDTAGDISSSAGTVEVTIGIAKSATELYFHPRLNQQLTEDEQDALAGTSGTPSASNKYVTADDVASDGTASKIVRLDGSSNLSTTAQVDFASLKTASEAQGDIMYRDASDWVRLGAGSSGQYLQTGGASNDPVWVEGGYVIGRAANSSPTSIPDNTTHYSAPNYNGATTTTEPGGFIVPFNGYIKNLYTRTGGTINSTLETIVRINGSDRLLRTTHSSGETNTNKSDTTNVHVVSAGDRVTFKLVNGNTGASDEPVSISVMLIPS